MNVYHVIKKPLITEKGSVAGQVKNNYFFVVNPQATKLDVGNAVEEIFKVKVVGVRTMNVRGKLRRVGKSAGFKPAWKKAIVTLKEGDRIELMEGA